MKYRVYLVASEYSAPLSMLTETPVASYRGAPRGGDDDARWRALFFSAPAEGQSWRDLGVATPPTLLDLLASAAHRALGSLHDLTGHDRYRDTCFAISDLLVASMPLFGTTPDSNVNTGLIPLMLRSILGLDFDTRCQFAAGTADSGASAFASAVRIAQARPATILVTAGQLMPSGYAGQYRIRSVFTPDEQSRGLDMMAVGDLLMDALRRTHAGPRFDLARCQQWLAEVRRVKRMGAGAYPAAFGVKGSDPSSAERFVTRYFRSADVAKAGCGAAAVVLTSDPEMLARIRRYGKALTKGRGKRFRNTPVVEVVGVGEGTTNPQFLSRRSPVVTFTSIRQALAAAADDAGLPLSVYPDSAFAVLHDAFPSMEMAFLLAVGLDWTRASLRMTTWWSNPFGGLLTFGDAVGASGLVHVGKAFHVFTGDRRYIVPALNPIRRFRREGSYAFASSVGGPLSHVVVAILRGGVPPTARDHAAFFDRPPRGDERDELAREEQRQRRRLRQAAEAYTARLESHDAGLWLVEGLTEIDARSCSQALDPELIDALGLERLRGMVADEHADACRVEVRALMHELRANYLAACDGEQVHAAREAYNAGLERLLDVWSGNGWVRSDRDIGAYLSQGAGHDQSDGGSADSGVAAAPAANQAAARQHRLKALKQCVRVPTAILIEPGKFERRLRFLSQLADLDHADFVRVESEPVVHSDACLLPWWNSRAERPEGTVPLPPGIAANPDAVFRALTADGRDLGAERAAELSFLRAYFAPSGPQAAVDLAMRDLGVMAAVDPELRFGKQVPAIFYKNDIIGSSTIEDVHEAYELLGRAVQRARGWFGMYASTCAQHGDSVSLVSLDRRLEPISGDPQSEARHARAEAISNASRFARDVAEWCVGYGIRLRTVVSFGHGVPYRDVNDDRSVASDSAIRGARLLDFVAREAHGYGFAHLPWIVFDLTELADIDDAVTIFEHELLAASGPNWRSPDGPRSPAAIDRWADITFTVWYRPEE